MDVDVSKLSTAAKLKVEQLYVSLYITDQLETPGFKGFAKSVSTLDKAGNFDVLPGHENFVTVFNKKIEIVPVNGEVVKFEAKKGILEVANNVVRIFLNR